MGRSVRLLVRSLVTCHLFLVICAAPASAQNAPVIVDVTVEQEGRVLEDRLIAGLIETIVGEPLSMADVRETYAHLTSLNRFDDVQVFQEPVEGGVRLRYVLYPLHPVDRMEFRGTPGLPVSAIRAVLTDRFGEAPPASRMADVAQVLRDLYRSRGYPAATVTPRIEETHNPDRASMIFEIEAGRRYAIGAVQVDEIDGADRSVPPGEIAVRRGDPYDAEAIARELERYEGELRGRGFYEAVASHVVTFDMETGTAAVRITVDRGPRVSVAFAGDPLPESDREQLVPIAAERSADEDLLEDAAFAIQAYLHDRGYRDARVQYTRETQDADLTITFDVDRGPRYVVDDVLVTGNLALPTDDVMQLLRMAPGGPFVQASLDAGTGALRDVYRARGFTQPLVQATVVERPADGATADVGVQVRVDVTEGPRAVVEELGFEGNTVFTSAELGAMMVTRPGRAYSEFELVGDRDRLDLEYRNRGYENVVVRPAAALVDGGTSAAVRVTISEGPQVVVDDIIIIGNERTSTETIERELLLRSGEPLGYSALIESQARLAALGLFRSVRIEPLAQGASPRRDVLVRVEEAPPTTIGYGGGIEGGTRLRPTGSGGEAEERFELAPRGFFEIGRRNLWGKNRSINLFTRVSLRSRDIVLTAGGVRLEEPPAGSYGFNEYRALLTFREPRIFGSAADVLVTGIVDQAIRSSFNFITREARAEAGLRLPRRYSLAGRYSYQHTRLFDERFTDEEKPLIDRLFPQVRLSKFSSSLIRDTRNDALDPDGGTFLIVDTEVAARAVGSEVGFVKTFVQGFGFHRLPTGRRAVLAFGARMGAARGFERGVPRLGPDGEPMVAPDGTPLVDVVHDLPASERFFAGGDTTVRGFSLDRLGTEETISDTGFPRGGNGLIVLNTELRVAVAGGFGVVGFVDAGNVFPRVSDLDLGSLRATAGFGLRYQSPVGPIRLDLGFKLDRRELTPGRLERRSVLHISLGQAF